MDLTPYLHRTLDGKVVVATWYPNPAHLADHYSVRFLPADDEDLMMLDFLKPETNEETYFE